MYEGGVGDGDAAGALDHAPTMPELTSSAPTVVAALTAWVAALPAATSEAENLTRITALETLKNVCAAAQARETVALDTARRDAEAGRGMPAGRRGKGVASEVALARRISPAQGARELGLARALLGELPNTMAALTSGVVSEWRATIVAKETGWLPVEGRRHVDAQLAPLLTDVGDRRLAAEARKLAQAWDPSEAVRHLRKAAGERCVSIRPAPDSMVYLTALLPMVQGVAAYAALNAHANAMIRTGQAGDKTRGQVMADTLVERLTGQSTAAAVPVEVHLIMTQTALLGGDRDDAPEVPAWVVGHGPLPPRPPGPCSILATTGSPGGRGYGSAACTPTGSRGTSSPWIPDAGSSMVCSAGWWSSGMTPAAPRGVTPPSGTSTTPRLTPPEGTPPMATPPGCVNAATRSRRTPAGSTPPRPRP